MDPALAKDWMQRWEKNILGDSRNRYCDREMGEEIGWLVSPFLNGFYYGYMATRRPRVDRPADGLGRLRASSAASRSPTATSAGPRRRTTAPQYLPPG